MLSVLLKLAEPAGLASMAVVAVYLAVVAFVAVFAVAHPSPRRRADARLVLAELLRMRDAGGNDRAGN
jgi:hypothetical protein